MAWLLYVFTAPAGPLAVIGKPRRTVARNALDPIADIAFRRELLHPRRDDVHDPRPPGPRHRRVGCAG